MKRRLLLIGLACLFSTGCQPVERTIPPQGEARDQATLESKSEGTSESAAVAASTERELVAAVRDKQEAGSVGAEFARAVQRIDELAGQIGFDTAGNVTSVDLAGDRLDRKMPSDADVALLRALPHLASLRLYGDAITNEAVRHCSNLPMLTDLALHATGVQGPGFEQLSQLGKLRALDLSNSAHLTDVDLAPIGRLTGLSELVLLNTNVTGAGLAQLVPIDGLRLLDLRGCGQIGDSALQPLSRFPQLSVVRLSGYGVTDAGLAVLGICPALGSLTIEDAAITDPGLSTIRSLPLEELTLFRCFRVTDAGLEHVAGLTKLKRLSLRGTPVNGLGLTHLADKRDLVQLQLSETMLDSAGIQQVRKLTSLTRLELRQTIIGDAGLDAVATLSRLTYLDLEGCGISDAGLVRLSPLTKLRTLVLAVNQGLTDACIPVLTQLKDLRELDISQTGISNEGAQQLVAALPACRVRHWSVQSLPAEDARTK